MNSLDFGKTGFRIPKMVIGTSSLGNLYRISSSWQKEQLVRTAIKACNELVFFDTAGKYGAGMSLESLGLCLKNIGVPKSQVLISNKLGWKRTPLVNGKPTFERDVWKGIGNDAVQTIGYDGIIECYEEGVELLGGYSSQMVSVHDPDEYLLGATTQRQYEERFEKILEAYAALFELKKQKKVEAIGIGSKDWRVIREIYKHVPLDWVMIANSMTLYHHPEELLAFMRELEKAGVGIINSAVFQSGFLVGGGYFDYELLDPQQPRDIQRFRWREIFFETCREMKVDPAHACIQFGLNAPGVNAVAINSETPDKLERNALYCETVLPQGFWVRLNEMNIISDELLELNITRKP